MFTGQQHKPDEQRNHAVVLGGGFAGLLSARALADHFAKVTVLEKDPAPTECAPRPGAPQGRHVHIFLPAGVAALEALFPGITAELIRAGAQPFDYGHSHLYVYGTWLPRVETKLIALAQTRPLLEQHVRQRVARLANVKILYGTSAGELILDAAKSRVTGVQFSLDGQAQPMMNADLFIDARGRNPRLPLWLKKSGFGSVPASSLTINLGYATGRFRVPREALPDSPLLYVVGPPPAQTRVGVIFQAEHDIVFAGMGGYHGDHPPGDLAGFMRFAKSLGQPHVYDVLFRGEPCSGIERFVIPASTRRRYQKMRNFPACLLPIGDTICSLDPAFGQGMTLAALSAKDLSECLARNGSLDSDLTEDYLQRADVAVSAAWDLSSRENLKYPQTTGPRPWLLPVAGRYLDFLVSAGDPRVMADIYRIMSLTAAPLIALRPQLAIRALRRSLARRWS